MSVVQNAISLETGPLVILFDIDGTLISTRGSGTRAWRSAFEQLHGLAPDIADYTEDGMTDPEVGRVTFARILGRPPTDQEVTRLLGVYLEQLTVEIARDPGYRVLPGVQKLLPRLMNAGILLGLVTGGLASAAHLKLARGNLNQYFIVGGYGSDSEDRGELTRLAIARCATIHGHAVSTQRVLIVGDTPRDIAAAHAADATAVGVATGKYTEEALHAAGADFVVPTLETPLPGVPND